MPENRLNIIQKEPAQDLGASHQSASNTRGVRRRELQAKFERLWLRDPQRFDPLRNCMEKERIERTWELLIKHMAPAGKKTVDIGCAAGVFSRRLKEHQADVEAIDIAENALKHFQNEGAAGIVLKQDAMPDTSLPEQAFDAAVCTDLIAELPHEDYRLFFAELARILTSEGLLICSSSIDIYSDGGVDRLKELAQTEFDIIDETESHHALYIRFKHFFEAPGLFIKGWNDPEVRTRETASRNGLSRWWYWMNSSSFLIWPWYIIQLFVSPILRFLKSSRRLLLILEKICRFLSPQEGISHYLFIARKRKILKVDPQDIPIEKLGRKEIWE